MCEWLHNYLKCCVAFLNCTFFRILYYCKLLQYIFSKNDSARNRRLRDAIDEYGRVVKRFSLHTDPRNRFLISRKNNLHPIEEYLREAKSRCPQDRILISFLLTAIPFDLEENCLNKRVLQTRKNNSDPIEESEYGRVVEKDFEIRGLQLEEERKKYAEIFKSPRAFGDDIKIPRYRRFDPNLGVPYSKKNRKTRRPGSWRIM